jgi:peptidoglycan/xylan/chitin deacetylase (PgdA/CDA1 family)
MRTRRWIIALVVVAALAFGAYKLFVHAGTALTPTVVTPQMDVHRALSPDLATRVSHLLHARSEDRSSRPRLIALTFDDGPYPVTTPLLLDVLHDLGIKATFFYIGRDAEQYPELARRTSLEGHEIADHTYSHPNLDELSAVQVAAEITKGARVLHEYSADAGIDTLFRPPHGRFTEETLDVAQQLHYHTILWSDDPGDWRTVTPQILASHVEEHATAPEIVLLHSGRWATIAMLPEIVSRFRKAGYEFVTVGTLLRSSPAELTNHPAKHPV